MNIRIVRTGGNYHQAVPLPEAIELPEGASLHDALRALREITGEEGALPGGTLVGVAGAHVGTVAECRDVPLHNGDELMLLGPVAGG